MTSSINLEIPRRTRGKFRKMKNIKYNLSSIQIFRKMKNF